MALAEQGLGGHPYPKKCMLSWESNGVCYVLWFWESRLCPQIYDWTVQCMNSSTECYSKVIPLVVTTKHQTLYRQPHNRALCYHPNPNPHNAFRGKWDWHA